MTEPRRRTAPVRRQRGADGTPLTAEQLRARAKAAADRRESEQLARERWERGQVVPHRITLALDIHQLYGPEVDIACGATEPAVDEWEAGIRYPTWEQLLALAELVAHDVRYFTPDDPAAGAFTPDDVVFVCYRNRRNWNPRIEIPAPILAFTPEAIAATLGGYCVACLDPQPGRTPIHTCLQTSLF